MPPSLGFSRPKDIELKYFDIAGAAEKVRWFTLLMGGVPFKDTRVSFGDWGKMKETTKFGQLPLMYLNGEEKPYAPPGAMLPVAGAITGLMPKDPVQAFKVDEAISLDDDLRREMRPSIMLSYDQTIKPKEKARKVKEMREKLAAERDPAVPVALREDAGEERISVRLLGDNRRCTVPHYVQVVGKRRHRPYSRRHHDQVPEHHRVSGEGWRPSQEIAGVPQQAQVRRRRYTA